MVGSLPSPKERTMYICYVDESGGFEAPNQGPGATPLMTFAGLIIRTDKLAALTADFLSLKRRFYPVLRTVRNLDLVLSEVKGSELRKRVRSPAGISDVTQSAS